jgi:3-oxoadipate enol-lactonase
MGDVEGGIAPEAQAAIRALREPERLNPGETPIDLFERLCRAPEAQELRPRVTPFGFCAAPPPKRPLAGSLPNRSRSDWVSVQTFDFTSLFSVRGGGGRCRLALLSQRAPSLATIPNRPVGHNVSGMRAWRSVATLRDERLEMHVRGVDLAVRESGHGWPLFWGHGLVGSMTQDDDAGLLDWASLAQSVRLVRFDARGHGGSETTLDPNDYCWAELSHDLWALADALGAPTPVLGGFSMGCATALHAAAERPERVKALVLVAPPTAWETRMRQARIYRILATVIERVGLSPFRCLASLSRVAAGPTYLSRLHGSVVDSLRRADPRSVVMALRGAAASDLPPPEALRHVRAPALVLAWRGDTAHPVATAERLIAILPNAELKVAGTLEEVHGWSPAIRDFLAALGPPPTAPAPPSSAARAPRGADRPTP